MFITQKDTTATNWFSSPSSLKSTQLVFSASRVNNAMAKRWVFACQQVGDREILVQLQAPLASIHRIFRFSATPAFTRSSKSDATVLRLLAPAQWTALRNFLARSLHGLTRGFQAELIIRGIGLKFRFYRRRGQDHVSFRLGQSHRVLYPVPAPLEFLANKRFDFLLFSVDKGILRANSELVRSLRSSDAYKGKGIKYDAAPLILKLGKVR